MANEAEEPSADNEPSQETGVTGRHAKCPSCGAEVDAAAFDPLETLLCEQCQTSFELLRKLGDFELTPARKDGTFKNVFFATNHETGASAIIKVLGAREADKPDGLETFLHEAEDLGARCRDDQVADRLVDQVDGFVYLCLLLKEGVPAETVLESLGLDEEPTVTFRLEAAPERAAAPGTTPPLKIEAGPIAAPDEDDVQAISMEEDTPVFHSPAPPPAPNKRTIPCPHCGQMVNAARCNPLDQVTCQACKTPFDLMRFMAHYCLERPLGEGGTSALYLARDTQTRQPVALKVLAAQEMLSNPIAIPTFQREIETMLELKHPNIVEVYEGGECDGFYYMAMEMIEGMTLSQILETIQGTKENEHSLVPPTTDEERNIRFRRAIPELVCLEVKLGAAAGLGAAHSKNFVHGDVKPENIMITWDGRVKVIDFGLVQFANTETLLAEGESFSVFGTPLYIPPERVRGESEDFRSDIYSLGATLYHLLRGIPPFRAKTPGELVMMHAEHLLVSFKAYVPTASDTTCRIVEKSLKKTVEDRYSSHVEFIADITLARNQVLQSMDKKLPTGQPLLQDFMKTMPQPEKPSSSWKMAATSMLKMVKHLSNTARTLLKRPPKEGAG
jgi:serine/threonine protein kinase